MKKRILSIMIVSAMLISTASAVMAETGSTGVTKSADEVVSTSVDEAAVQPVYAKHENLTVAAVEDGRIETKAEDGTTIYLNTNEAVIYANNGEELSAADIKADDVIMSFTRGDKPAIAIYPPVYTPDVIVKVDAEYAGTVAVSTFAKEADSDALINKEGDLVLNLGEDVELDTSKENDLIVFYSIATMSIPPQTSPEKVVVLNAEPQVQAQAEKTYEESAKLTVTSVDGSKIEAADGDAVYTLNAENAVIYNIDGTEAEAVKKDDVITAYTSKENAEAFAPSVIIVNDEETAMSVDVSKYTKDGEQYVNEDNTLVLNPAEGMEIDENTYYITFYSMTTRSLPPQTTPEKMVPFAKDEAEVKTQFTDVAADSVFAGSINAAVEKGLFKGVSDTEFNPEGSMTRAMFVTVLGRLNGEAVKDACVTGFEDAAGDQYYSSYVAWANKNNIVKGYEDGTFRPDNQVTREEALQIIWNFCEFKGLTPEEGAAWMVNVDYADADSIAEYAFKAAAWNVINKFLLTDKDNSIRPKDEITRAEAAYAMNVLADLDKSEK